MNTKTDPPLPGAENMRRDVELFEKLEREKNNQVYLRFYSWSEPTISLGNTQKKMRFDEDSRPVVVRPTGGGVVFHQPGDFTYALVAPLGSLPKGVIPSCNAISKVFVSGLAKIGIKAELAGRRGTTAREAFCFDRPSKYEIMVNDQKLMGSAQKRGRYALLQQGTIQSGVVNLPDYKKLAKIFTEEFKKLFIRTEP